MPLGKYLTPLNCTVRPIKLWIRKKSIRPDRVAVLNSSSLNVKHSNCAWFLESLKRGFTSRNHTQRDALLETTHILSRSSLLDTMPLIGFTPRNHQYRDSLLETMLYF